MTRRRGKARFAVIRMKAEFRALMAIMFVGALVSWTWVGVGFRPIAMPTGGEGPRVVKEARVDESAKAIAVTFDDGPNPTFTPQVLSLLDRYKARATFFVSGIQAEKFPDLLREISVRGHEIGNHCYQHIDFTKLPLERFLTDVQRADALIAAATGGNPVLYRPTLGRYSPTMVAAMAAQGRRTILWSYKTNSNDSWLNPSAHYIVSRVTNGVKPGSIVLLHDHGGNRTNTVVALGEILPILSARGFSFVTVGELLKMETVEK